MEVRRRLQKTTCVRTQGTETYKLYSKRLKDTYKPYSQHLFQNEFTLFDKINKLCGSYPSKEKAVH